MEVPIELVRILINEGGDSQIIVVKERDGERRFPISIGFFEAAAIDRRLKNVPIPRPMTHELLASTIAQLGGRLERVVISDLVNGTFIAKLVIAQNGRMVEVESRPSDAIALAVGDDTPLYCDEKVLAAAALPPGEAM
jgi:bifunctional DNase/RNase